MEVIPAVHLITIGQGAFTGVFPPNTYLVGGEKPVLIDSGYEADAPARLQHIEQTGLRPAFILLSHPHPDHIGGAPAIKRATGAQIVLHRHDASEAGEVDRLVEGGEVFGSGEGEIEVVHTPGHTPGACCFFLRRSGVLFSGDHILGLGTTVISQPRGDMGRYMDSLRKLLNYPLKMICPGHGPVVRDARRKVEELLQHRVEREEQVLSCLRQGRCREEEMVAEIYNELEPRLEGLARQQVKAHLIKLMQEGRVVAREGEYFLR